MIHAREMHIVRRVTLGISTPVTPSALSRDHGGIDPPMRPDDANGRRAFEDRPFRVLVIAGSNRRQYDCLGADSKARTLMFRMADRLPKEWEIDPEDLGNIWHREQIRSCN